MDSHWLGPSVKRWIEEYCTSVSKIKPKRCVRGGGDTYLICRTLEKPDTAIIYHKSRQYLIPNKFTVKQFLYLNSDCRMWLIYFKEFDTSAERTWWKEKSQRKPKFNFHLFGVENWLNLDFREEFKRQVERLSS